MAAPTDAELLAAFKSALLSVSTGQSYTINNRTLTRANLKEIRETIAWLEQRIDVADTTTDETGTGIALVNFR